MNPMMLMQMVFGDRFKTLMNKWSAMTPEQKQTELNKVRGMSNEQRMEYLKNMGIDTNMLQQYQQQNNQTQKFNY